MTQIPAGWYPDPAPGDPGRPPGQRYWDGQRWTEHVHVPWGQQPAQPQPPQPGEVKTTPDGERLAEWLPRLGAWLIDSVILGVATLVLSLPWLISYIRSYSAYMEDLLARAEGGAEPPSPVGWMSVGLGDLVTITLIGLLVAVVYHATFLRLRGATPGKMLLGLQVRLRERPGQLPWSAIALRLLVQQGASLFSAIPFASLVVGWFPILNGLWPLWDGKNQALHDKAARTNVVVRR